MQSEGLDRLLPPGKWLALRLHLIICQWCRRYGKQIRFLHRAVHKHGDEWAKSSVEQLSPAARDRLKQQLQSSAK